MCFDFLYNVFLKKKILILRIIQGESVNKHKCSYEVPIVIFVFNEV